MKKHKKCHVNIKFLKGSSIELDSFLFFKKLLYQNIFYIMFEKVYIRDLIVNA